MSSTYSLPRPDRVQPISHYLGRHAGSDAIHLVVRQASAIQRLGVRRLESVLILGGSDDPNQQKHGQGGRHEWRPPG